MGGSRYRWTLVALLWVVALLNYLDRQVIFAVFPLLEKDLRVSSVELGLLGTAFLWIYGVLSPLGGWLADRMGRRGVILLSLGVWSAVTILTGLARNYHELLIARALMGISEACYLPAALAMIADYHGERTRSRATGLHQSGLYAGIALGGLGGGWMGDHYGWRPAFFVLGAAGLVYAVVLAAGLKESPERRPRAARADPPLGESLRELAGSAPFRVVVLANMLASIAYWCVYTWLALFLFERFQVSLTTAGFSSTFYIQAASFAGILGGGWLADRWSRTNARGRLWTQAIGLFIAGPFLLMAGTTGFWWVLLPCLVCFGLGRGFFDCNLMPVVCQMVPASLRATAYGILNLTSCIAGGAMTAAGGWFKDRIGLGGAIQISAVLLLVAAACLAVLRVGGPRGREEAEAEAA
ncbi:MAG: MFS transporter [Acidobacteria bacterium]|nr:MFS transporter [Acidobacteriota bacterium]